MFEMRSVLIVFVLISVVFGQLRTFTSVIDEWRTLAQNYLSECICETKVNPLLVKRLLDHLEFPDDACLKCNLKCWSMKTRIMDPVGDIDIDIMAKTLSGLSREGALYCKQKVQGILDLCQKAADLAACSVGYVNATLKSDLVGVEVVDL